MDDDSSSEEDRRTTESQPFKKRRLVAEPVAVIEEKGVESNEVDMVPIPHEEPTPEVTSSNVVIHDDD